MLKLVMAIAFLCGTTALAHDMDMMNKELTKEQRAVMADHHEKMAACLRSDKPMKQCHEEMEKHCKEAGANCPMNEMHEMHDHAKKADKATKAK